MNKKMILVSHGKLSKGMAHSVQMICGENEDLSYYGMMPGEHYSTIVEAIRTQAQENPDTQYIVVADLLGGSVCNGCTELTTLENVKLISGMNMALILELIFAETPITDEMIEESLNNCKEVIRQVKPEEFTSGQSDDSEEFF